MKNKYVYLLTLFMVFYSCNQIIEDKYCTNDQDLEKLKLEVLAFAEENGVKVYIQEEVWKKNLPSLESIKKTILETRNFASDSIQSNKLQAKYYYPTRLKTGGEIDDPIVEGSYSSNEQFTMTPDYTGITYFELDVDWVYGGTFTISKVTFSGTCDNLDYPYMEARIYDPEYSFYGHNFSATCHFMVYEYSNHVGFMRSYFISTSYNNLQGYGVVAWFEENGAPAGS